MASLTNWNLEGKELFAEKNRILTISTKNSMVNTGKQFVIIAKMISWRQLLSQ